MVLPATMRLRGHRCFNRLHRSSKRQDGTLMVLRVAAGDSNLLRRELRRIEEKTCRCALVISNKVSKRAVMRNRLRRLLHDHLRRHFERRNDLTGQWLLLSLRPEAAEAEPTQLLEECDSLLRRAGLDL
ncbi:ribonuclease P protein component [Synechococcus sp. MU1642]|uniref:ribonuclease P protein component n=1 Tax=Synechococcus sp. MU1642 TaxID=2508348 RepID=UPI001CF8CB5C|nr:ribonuclease P protein component [Synechococcus sp. MU1642]MCB4407672.1 ribonuclease P protein component [Synechococcus sp. MU1642]